MEHKENSGLFRKKSLERVASPERLMDYMKVTNPPVWMLLAAVIFLLAGFLLWAYFGHLDVTVKGGAEVENHQATMYLNVVDARSVKAGMPFIVGGKESTVDSVSRHPILTNDRTNVQILEWADVDVGDPVYVITAWTDAANGLYPASVVTERITPASFLTK